MAVADDIHIRLEGRAGRITLTRPGVLNALTYDMAMAIERALEEWRTDDAVALVLIDAAGDRAFCAGGDIQALYEHGKAGDFAFGRTFWRDEYRLNAAIAEYPKPCVAFLQGFVMGGGVGIGCHGAHRIVCENSQIAMPECSIGLIPDVGGSYLLSRAPGRAGEYYGLTGQRMNAGDAIRAGFADCFVPRDRWEDLKARLCADAEIAAISACTATAPEPALDALQPSIDRFFAADSALDCTRALEADGSDWCQRTATAIRRSCPISIACAFELVRMARRVETVREALALELRFTWRSQSHGEFVEGVRAQIIDKDRNPQWRTARLEDVTPQMIAEMLAPVDERQRAGV